MWPSSGNWFHSPGVFQHVLLVSLLRCHRGAAGGRMRPGFTAQGGTRRVLQGLTVVGGQKHVVWTCTAEWPRAFILIKLCSLNMKLIFLWFCRSSSGAVRLHLCSIFSLCSLPAEPARALTPDSVQNNQNLRPRSRDQGPGTRDQGEGAKGGGVGSGNSSSQKETTPSKQTGRVWGGGGAGDSPKPPTWDSGVCCALSQWAQSPGDVLTAARQSRSERPGGVRPAAGSEYKVRGVWSPAAERSCSSDTHHGLPLTLWSRSRTREGSLYRSGLPLVGTLFREFIGTAASPRCGFFSLSWILWIISVTSTWRWRRSLDPTAPTKSKLPFTMRNDAPACGCTSLSSHFRPDYPDQLIWMMRLWSQMSCCAGLCVAVLTASVSLQDGDGESGPGGAAGRGSAAGGAHAGGLRVRQTHECVSTSFTLHISSS